MRAERSDKNHEDNPEQPRVAFHHDGEVTGADTVRREVTPGEVEAMRAVVRRFVPAADGALRSTAVCLYTNTPDGHFWIDRHPRCPQVLRHLLRPLPGVPSVRSCPFWFSCRAPLSAVFVE